MKRAIVTGSCGLIGSHASRFFHGLGFSVLGIDNFARESFFGELARTSTMEILKELPRYSHLNASVLDSGVLDSAFRETKPDIVVHAAGQPSHDWAAEHPFEDFEVNARGTLNMLCAARKHSPDTVFITTSTNKVYGDRPNLIAYSEGETRWEPSDPQIASIGFDENLSVDQCKHSLFGASKLYADVITQEFARYFGMRTGVFRLGCVTGSLHAGVEQHGFLSYLFRCVSSGFPYVVHGHKGKQVRDNIHAFDVATAFYEFYKDPDAGGVYNLGGGRDSNCSLLEAISALESLTDRKLRWTYSERPREGDHIWYVSNVSKFRVRYPAWSPAFSMQSIFENLLSGGGR